MNYHIHTGESRIRFFSSGYWAKEFKMYCGEWGPVGLVLKYRRENAEGVTCPACTLLQFAENAENNQ